MNPKRFYKEIMLSTPLFIESVATLRYEISRSLTFTIGTLFISTFHWDSSTPGMAGISPPNFGKVSLPAPGVNPSYVREIGWSVWLADESLN